MADEERKFSKGVIGKTVVSKTGKRFGEVGDIVFETKSGELIHLVLKNPTPYVEKLELEKDKEGSVLIPFSAVISSGDFVVVAEEDIV
ncbi:PRC-barrel domain-containing protein [Candidatus Woesearchaeota archaeon]|nr:PRC-barrel domain-containing protein [Candidatus Woesearchaeota archaeon]